jgi:hypothetical protein
VQKIDVGNDIRLLRELFTAHTNISQKVADSNSQHVATVPEISLKLEQIYFQTKWDDSALFYASGEIDGTPHYVAASIINGSVYVELDFGHNSKISTMLGDYVTSDHWNNLTIFHNGSLVFVSLDDEVKVLEVPGEYYNMIIDPEIYIGGGPELQKKKGLQSHNNFAGISNFAISKKLHFHFHPIYISKSYLAKESNKES